MLGTRSIPGYLLPLCLLFLAACSQEQVNEPVQRPEQRFTVAVIPDTQNYVDFTLQKSAGFPLDSSELFIQQMHYIAGRSAARGGDIAFLASVGDVWQHVLGKNDPGHASRGLIDSGNDLGFDTLVRPVETLDFEIPKAIEGYQLISQAGIPFGVAPGNHDYDAWWATTGNKRDVSPLNQVGKKGKRPLLFFILLL